MPYHRRSPGECALLSTCIDERKKKTKALGKSLDFCSLLGLRKRRRRSIHSGWSVCRVTNTNKTVASGSFATQRYIENDENGYPRSGAKVNGNPSRVMTSPTSVRTAQEAVEGAFLGRQAASRSWSRHPENRCRGPSGAGRRSKEKEGPFLLNWQPKLPDSKTGLIARRVTTELHRVIALSFQKRQKFQKR